MNSKLKRIIFVRHGESEGNTNTTIYLTVKDRDVSLTKKGHEDAEIAGKKIRNILNVNHPMVFVSPFKRTLQTWEEIQKTVTPLSIHEDSRIIEKVWEIFQTKDDMDQFVKSTHFKDFFYKKNGAESLADLFNRTSSFIDSLILKSNMGLLTEDVIVVSHWWAIACMKSYLENIPHDQFHSIKIANCEPYILEIEDSIFGSKN